MLVINTPKSFKAEREYVCHVILSVFLGINYCIKYVDDINSIKVDGECGSINIADVLFSKSDELLYNIESLPKLPLDVAHYNDFATTGNAIPVLYGEKNSNGKYITNDGKTYYIGIDIFGSAFFMLTRMEEYIIKERDEHDRFPVESSVAYKAGFLERPIINEYVELLWYFLKKIEPSLKRIERVYKVIPTHDIDKPFGMVFDTPLQIIRHFAGDIIYRKSAQAVLNRVQETFLRCFRKAQYIANRSETFVFINAESDKHDLKDVFFFMNSKKSWYDGNYTVDEPHVLDIIAKLVSKGHHIGLHPSFDSYMNGEEIKNEVELMNDIFAKNQLPSLSGARQHYLKWNNPNTWQYYEEAGIPFDSTMTYAGHVGFRCGVCYPFPVFNLETRHQLKLIEHPLIVMDGTLYEYMGVSHEEAMPVIKKLANECKKYKGEFVILWHNTMLDDEHERVFYSKMLDEVCD